MKLDEATIDQIDKKTVSTDHTRVEKSHNVKSKYIGISKNGDLQFKTSSEDTPGRLYYQTIEIPSIIKNREKYKADGLSQRTFEWILKNDDVKLHCTDPSWKFWAWQYMGTKDNYSVEPETRAPKRNNTLLRGGLCKHLKSVVDLVKDPKTRQQIVNDINIWVNGGKPESQEKADFANKYKPFTPNWKMESAINTIISKAYRSKGLAPKEFMKALADVKGQSDITLDKFLTDTIGVTIDDIENEINFPRADIEGYFRNKLRFGKDR